MNGWRGPAIGVSAVIALAAAAVTLGMVRTQGSPQPRTIGWVADEYVRLVAALSARDPDSASGDTASFAAPVARQPGQTLVEIANAARATIDALDALDASTDSARRQWLRRQLVAVAARAALQSGSRLPFKTQLQQLFAVDAVPVAGADVEIARSELQRLLPGAGSPASRLDAFDATVTVPPDRLPVVFNRALDECRARTRRRVPLPAGEGVEVVFVTGEPWSGFSTYLGKARSRIRVNTGYPLTVDRVLELACHEGYPGHHVMNVLRSERAVAGRPELTAVSLFSPEAFLSEAVASRAASMVFSDEDRLVFERDTLFPLAGLGSGAATRHVRIARLLDRVSPAIGAALARYLSGDRDFVETSWALQEQALMQHPGSTVRFANQFGGFALAYTWMRKDPAELWQGYEGVLRETARWN